MCTSFTIKSIDGHLFFGRTLDFLYDLTDPQIPFAAQVRIEPVGTTFHGQLEQWQSKYKIGGVAVKQTAAYYDAINERGLCGELNALVESGAGQLSEIKSASLHPLMGEELVTYFVSQFASVADIRKHYQDFAIADVPFKAFASDPLFDRIPCHYTFTDTTGDSIVLEPVDHGKLKLFDSVGALTNSPTYDWHLTNLRNYVHLNGHNAGNSVISPIVNKKPFTAEQVGFGSGLLGMPGDYTSTSRFIRAVFLSHFADPFPSEQGLNTLFNLFNSVFVPKGVEHLDANSPLSDHTEYWSGYALSERTLVVRSQKSNAFLKRSLADYDEEAVFDLPTEMVFN